MTDGSAGGPRKTQGIRMPSGRITTKVVSLPPEVPWWRSARFLFGVVVVAGIGVWFATLRRPGVIAVTEAPAAASPAAARKGGSKAAPAVAGARAPRPAPVAEERPVTIDGEVLVSRGPIVVLRHEGTLYGFQRSDGHVWPEHRPGERLSLEGVKSHWNPVHGYYVMDSRP